MDESWKTFYISKAGMEYAISSRGRVKNIARNKLVKPNICRHVNRVYMWAQIRKDGRTFKLSRLVAENFVPNPEHKPWVDHINHNPLDNRAENLRWVTPTENKRSIISTESILKNMEKWFSMDDIARYTGLEKRQVEMYLLRGTTKIRENYLCEYLDYEES